MGDIFSSQNSFNTHSTFNIFLQIFIFILLVLSGVSHGGSLVRSLPGYPGNLPFRLETGYIGVGKQEEVQLFYYFVQSERDPKSDPLFIWLTGGPGCSALSGLVLETGPLNFNFSDMSWQYEVPKFKLNPYSWTKVASIIYLDSPVGTGFSYATNSEGYYSDDVTVSKHTYAFLRKWLLEHVEFQHNPLYITGDSYSGIPIPIIVQEVLHGNKADIGLLMNIKGYILGNPLTTIEEHGKSTRYMFARRVSLLSDGLYEATRISCHGNYDKVDPGNEMCLKNLQTVLSALDPLFINHVLEPKCDTSIPPKWCRDNDYNRFAIWANDLKVQQALHIQEGTKVNWTRCNRTSAYTKNVPSSFDYHLNLTKELLHALIYSGDQDMSIPYVGTVAWIRKLNLSVIKSWRPWFVQDQVAGYTTKYSNGHYHLTFATVKGAGHTAPEYKPQECLAMLKNWFRSNSLG